MSAQKRRVALSLMSMAVGLVIAGLYIGRSGGGDLGLLFLPLGLMYGVGITLLANSIAELFLGTPRSKKMAIIILTILAIATAYALYTSQKGGQNHYCNGKPANQYPGPLPANCSY